MKNPTEYKERERKCFSIGKIKEFIKAVQNPKDSNCTSMKPRLLQ